MSKDSPSVVPTIHAAIAASASESIVLPVEMQQMRLLLLAEQADAAQANVLRGFGFVLGVTDSLAQAQTLLADERQSPYEMILIDVQDALLCVQQLQQNPIARYLPMILLLAKEQQTQLLPPLQTLGLAHFLTKPITAEQVWQVLQKLFGYEHSDEFIQSEVMPSEPAAEQALAEFVSQLIGLHQGKILQLWRADPALLFLLVQQFLHHHSAAGSKIRQFLEAGNQHEAMRIAHTIAGTCGQFADGSLTTSAKKLEQAIAHETWVEVSALLDEFELRLHQVLAQLQQLDAYLNSHHPSLRQANDGDLLTPQKLLEACKELALLIDDDFAAALDFSKTLGCIVDDAIIQDELRGIKQSLQNCDIECAQHHVKQLIEHLLLLCA